jgi:hypothetical protein
VAVRIVILSSSVFSETAAAMAAHLAARGHVPWGAIALPTLDRTTLLRKFAQWGPSKVARYAGSKLIPRNGAKNARVNNPYLQSFLEHETGVFRSLRQVAAFYEFPIFICPDQNSPASIARLREWSPDLIIFTGGNILRKQLLEVPRLGVLNLHLGLLPEIRGMSSPEWSLLQNIPPGITLHYMNEGIDTGPILQRLELPGAAQCESIGDLRNRLIAFAVERTADVVSGLNRGTISATPQSDPDSSKRDNQFFVMHKRLQARAAECLKRSYGTAIAGTATANG